MSALAPIKYRDFCRGLRAFGWDGPFKQNGKEGYWTNKNGRRLAFPNKHGKTIDDPGLVADVLDRFGITQEAWLKKLDQL